MDTSASCKMLLELAETEFTKLQNIEHERLATIIAGRMLQLRSDVDNEANDLLMEISSWWKGKEEGDAGNNNKASSTTTSSSSSSTSTGRSGGNAPAVVVVTRGPPRGNINQTKCNSFKKNSTTTNAAPASKNTPPPGQAKNPSSSSSSLSPEVSRKISLFERRVQLMHQQVLAGFRNLLKPIPPHIVQQYYVRGRALETARLGVDEYLSNLRACLAIHNRRRKEIEDEKKKRQKEEEEEEEGKHVDPSTTSLFNDEDEEEDEEIQHAYPFPLSSFKIPAGPSNPLEHQIHAEIRTPPVALSATHSRVVCFSFLAVSHLLAKSDAKRLQEARRLDNDDEEEDQDDTSTMPRIALPPFTWTSAFAVPMYDRGLLVQFSGRRCRWFNTFSGREYPTPLTFKRLVPVSMDPGGFAVVKSRRNERCIGLLNTTTGQSCTRFAPMCKVLTGCTIASRNCSIVILEESFGVRTTSLRLLPHRHMSSSATVSDVPVGLAAEREAVDASFPKIALNQDAATFFLQHGYLALLDVTEYSLFHNDDEEGGVPEQQTKSPPASRDRNEDEDDDETEEQRRAERKAEEREFRRNQPWAKVREEHRSTLLRGGGCDDDDAGEPAAAASPSRYDVGIIAVADKAFALIAIDLRNRRAIVLHEGTLPSRRSASSSAPVQAVYIPRHALTLDVVGSGKGEEHHLSTKANDIPLLFGLLDQGKALQIINALNGQQLTKVLLRGFPRFLAVRGGELILVSSWSEREIDQEYRYDEEELEKKIHRGVPYFQNSDDESAVDIRGTGVSTRACCVKLSVLPVRLRYSSSTTRSSSSEEAEAAAKRGGPGPKKKKATAAVAAVAVDGEDNNIEQPSISVSFGQRRDLVLLKRFLQDEPHVVMPCGLL